MLYEVITSYRDIEIRSEDGSVKVYDLFKFRRYADKKNNPYRITSYNVCYTKLLRSIQVTSSS